MNYIMDLIDSQAGQVLVGLIAIISSLIFFAVQQRKGNQISKADVYLKLELASNELFRFQAQYAEQLEPFLLPQKPETINQIRKSHFIIAENFIFQTLNLFEIAIRLRKEKVFEPRVFCSWVAWYCDTLEGWYFRSKWAEFRTNYTTELHQVFDEFSSTMEEAQKSENSETASAEVRKKFFQHVGKIIGCSEVKTWLDDIKR